MPDVESFCDRYPAWKDSLASQLQYHHLFSQAAGLRTPQSRASPSREITSRNSSWSRSSAREDRRASSWPGTIRWAASAWSSRSRWTRARSPRPRGRSDHPHIVPVNSVAFQPERGLRGLSMPFRQGLPLDEIIKPRSPGRPASRGAHASGRSWSRGQRRADPSPAPEEREQAPPREAQGRRLERLPRARDLRARRRLDRDDPGTGAPLCPRHADLPPRRQAGQCPDHHSPRAPVARLQPGGIAPCRPACRVGDARGDPPLHGPRADRGLPQPRPLGERGREGRPLFPGAGPAGAAHRPGAGLAGRQAPARPVDAHLLDRRACLPTDVRRYVPEIPHALDAIVAAVPGLRPRRTATPMARRSPRISSVSSIAGPCTTSPTRLAASGWRTGPPGTGDLSPRTALTIVLGMVSVSWPRPTIRNVRKPPLESVQATRKARLTSSKVVRRGDQEAGEAEG